jgi:tetratricopeptide (TPR) repeat protein
LGEDHPETLFTRRNLAQAYEEAGRHRDAELKFQRTVEAAGRAKPRNDRVYSDSLAMLGRFLIARQRYAEALPGLRECVAIKEKGQSDDWSTAQARSLLGEALAGLGEYAEAEPLLLSAQKDLNERREKIRPLDRPATLRDSVDRLVRIYQAWGKPAEAEEWKKTLASEPSSRVAT